MYLKDLKIKNFRNYDTLELKLEKGINIIYGSNGQGKTNLLESLYFLGMTKSHRSYIDNSLVKNDEKFFKITGNLYDKNMKTKLEIIYDGNEKKLKKDNYEIKRISDYISLMNIIIFYPDDLSLIKGSPSERRRFLNAEISQLYGDYLNIVNDYTKILKMRNDYLKKNNFDENYYSILTNFLVDKAIIIYKMRSKFIERINENLENIYDNLSGIKTLKLIYKTSIEFEKYDKEYLKEKLLDAYKKERKKEIKNKITLIGPHRDELEFTIGDNNIKNFGSQGQQRMAILATKLSEIEIIKKYKQSSPILLLDDVFSELDKKKKNNLLKYIDNKVQTIITTTDLNNINKKIRNESKLIEIDNGKIKKMTEVIR